MLTKKSTQLWWWAGVKGHSGIEVHFCSLPCSSPWSSLTLTTAVSCGHLPARSLLTSWNRSRGLLSPGFVTLGLPDVTTGTSLVSWGCIAKKGDEKDTWLSLFGKSARSWYQAILSLSPPPPPEQAGRLSLLQFPRVLPQWSSKPGQAPWQSRVHSCLTASQESWGTPDLEHLTSSNLGWMTGYQPSQTSQVSKEDREKPTLTLS